MGMFYAPLGLSDLLTRRRCGIRRALGMLPGVQGQLWSGGKNDKLPLHGLTLRQLDYYVILGDGTLPSVLTEYARLVSPASSPSVFAASPTLPPLSQFGYLSSSLALSAEPHAQEAIIQFLKDCRINGFPVDALHLSSGWCQGTFPVRRPFDFIETLSHRRRRQSQLFCLEPLALPVARRPRAIS